MKLSLIKYLKRIKSVYLYQLLRPEFVKNYKIPLCSDAFSSFPIDPSEKIEHESEIIQATQFLETILIPSYAGNL